MRIKDIAPENRPRERFISSGPEALSDAELLAIVLQKGSREENVVDMSNRLISRFGLDKLSMLSLKEMQQIKGIGPAKAMQILSVFALALRLSMRQSKRHELLCAEHVFEYASPRIGQRDREHLMVIMLDSKNRVIADSVVSVGILNQTITHAREIFKDAIKNSANAVILVHNHPSGDVEVSKEDVAMTKKIRQAGEVIGIKVLDHVIVSRDRFESVR